MPYNAITGRIDLGGHSGIGGGALKLIIGKPRGVEGYKME